MSKRAKTHAKGWLPDYALDILAPMLHGPWYVRREAEELQSLRLVCKDAWRAVTRFRRRNPEAALLPPTQWPLTPMRGCELDTRLGPVRGTTLQLMRRVWTDVKRMHRRLPELLDREIPKTADFDPERTAVRWLLRKLNVYLGIVKVDYADVFTPWSGRDPTHAERARHMNVVVYMRVCVSAIFMRVRKRKAGLPANEVCMCPLFRRIEDLWGCQGRTKCIENH